MLNTLRKIGITLLEGQGIWARLTQEPKYTADKENWICPVLFDCVDKKIKVLNEELRRFYPESSVIEFRYLNTELWGRRGKKVRAYR